MVAWLHGFEVFGFSGFGVLWFSGFEVFGARAK